VTARVGHWRSLFMRIMGQVCILNTVSERMVDIIKLIHTDWDR
jgi:hypothetical protein